MLNYKISYQYPNRQLIDFELIIDNINSESIDLQLPAWRPGRYELQHFAKNIQQFQVFDLENKPVFFEKTKKDRWKVKTEGISEIKVCYNYYAHQFDAGGSWLEDRLLYINFVNCCLYVDHRLSESYEMNLQIPDDFQIACGLKKEGKKLFAKDFYELADAPLIASPDLQCQTYSCQETTFYLWFWGKVKPNWERIICDWRAFTEAQIQIFGEFPEKDYHFLYLILPFQYYHGVEHHNSTVIVMGKEQNFEDFYDDLLGISSHELFHAWNIIKIRPAEMLSYDFTGENYFKTGFVAEGLTTYYGDYLLARANVWTKEQYFEELNILFRRHFDNFGRLNMSVADSSFDLWLDGYVAGIPNRKSSIYVEGAIAALILDLEIRQISDNQRSMDNIMQILWTDYGKTNKGYTFENYLEILGKVAEKNMQNYAQECLLSPNHLENRLNLALDWVACKLTKKPAKNDFERFFGCKTSWKNDILTVVLIQPNSPADRVLALGDQILSINGKTKQEIDLDNFSKMVNLQIIRNFREKNVQMFSDSDQYLPIYLIEIQQDASEKALNNLAKWLKY
ncbi:MAG: M61 family peptidase [Bacteroidetes bacterium]|nr:MAG: M61 family peptidase [Bacteroidota bacterium]